MTKRSRFGWLDFLLGLVLVVLGVYTLFNPQAALGGVVVVYSIVAIVAGIADIVFYTRLKSNVGIGPTVTLVTGILSVLAGFMLLLNPVVGRWIFSLAFPVWVMAHSISRLASHRAIRFVAGKGVATCSLVLSILGILAGVLMFLSPTLSAMSLGYLVAVSLVLHGVGNILEAFSRIGEQDRIEHEDWDSLTM